MKQYFLQLTGLRAIAAYMVFLTHVIPNKDFAKNNFTAESANLFSKNLAIHFLNIDEK